MKLSIAVPVTESPQPLSVASHRQHGERTDSEAPGLGSSHGEHQFRAFNALRLYRVVFVGSRDYEVLGIMLLQRHPCDEVLCLLVRQS